MSYIHKYNVTASGPQYMNGEHEVPGTPRTIGVDPAGNLCVWYEADVFDNFNQRFYVQWTGDEMYDNTTLVSTCVWHGLVWHLCVTNDDMPEGCGKWGCKDCYPDGNCL